MTPTSTIIAPPYHVQFTAEQTRSEFPYFPFHESVSALWQQRGDKKDLLARGNRGHMGNPGAENILYAWIDDAVAGKP